MSNPYNQQTQEQLYLAYEHGLSSTDKDLDCPYTHDDGKPYEAWMKGWNSNMGRKKKVEKTPIISETLDSPEDTQPLKDPSYFQGISSFSDEELFEELRNRKKDEYKKLLQLKEEINKQLAKLSFLFEE